MSEVESVSLDGFPTGFVVGLASSGHQVEGDNRDSDWWEFETLPDSGCVEPSGRAVEHFLRYRDDIRLFRELGMTAYRFSVEWSRVEPREGQFDPAAIRHYVDVVRACRESGIFPMVTLSHFSMPAWIWREGGWTSSRAPEAFRRFVEHVVPQLGTEVGAYCTLNEPNLPMCAFYDRKGERFHKVNGLEMPFPMCHAQESRDVQLEAHRLAVRAVRAASSAPVGMTLNMSEYVAIDGGESKVEEIRRECEDVFLEACREDDFVGVQNYGRRLVGPEGFRKWEGEVDFLGCDYAPQALDACLRHAASVSGKACYVTEHGSCFPGDERRRRMVDDAMRSIARCLRDGIDVRGYFHWCAFDAFEWRIGYKLDFGAIAVDRETQVRSPKPSARRIGVIARYLAGRS